MNDSNQNVFAIFKTHRIKKIVKALIPILVEKRNSNITEFYDLLGELIKEDFEFFLNRKVYFYLKKDAAKIVSATTLSEMDRYILENFCFNPEEKLITSTRGVFVRPKGKLTGYLYLTNFRLIGDGVLSEKQSSTVTSHSALRALVKGAVGAVKDAQVAAVRKALKISMGDKFSDKALKIFPHHFPITNAYNIKKGNKNVSYTMTLEYEDKGRMKSKVMNFKIVPKSEKGETNFGQRLGENLNKIEETLLKAQS